MQGKRWRLQAGEIANFGGEFKVDSGHTEWVDARAHQTGFTTTFPPNQKIPYWTGGKEYDIDFNSMREGRSSTLPTYAVVTSRSYHSGGVNSMRKPVVEGVGHAIWLRGRGGSRMRAEGDRVGMRRYVKKPH